MIPPNCQLYLAVTFGNHEIVKVVSDTTVNDSRGLFSTQEEVNTRMTPHALYCDTNLREMEKSGRIIIRISDTDVIVFCVHYFKQMTHISELWVQMGNISSVKDWRRFLPIHQLCAYLSPTICKLLLVVHALTGCNITSSMFGVGDKSTMITVVCRALKVLTKMKSLYVQTS
ncbi:unnamed protein product [Mytilus coruscus]|uniref:Uncharacterized protein n=1 Tax=Mytilus coruscus TaxID=42192 RepID=A0A6J8ADV1_MYTCO|nr:unnamed protein product [Mytilus coruscus]